MKINRLKTIICLLMIVLMLCGSSIAAFAGTKPSDYTGLGYYLKMLYKVDPVVYDKETNPSIALGGLTANIVYAKDQWGEEKTLLHVEGYYEADPAKLFTKRYSSQDHGDIYEYVGEQDFPIDLMIADKSSNKYKVTLSLHLDFPKDKNAYYYSDEAFCGSFEEDFILPNYDATLRQFWKKVGEVNGEGQYVQDKGYVSWPLDENGKQIEGKWSPPPYLAASSWKPGELHYYALKKEDIKSLDITRLLGTHVYYSVPINGEAADMSGSFIDGLALASKEEVGNNIEYTLQVKTDMPKAGSYEYTFHYRLPNDSKEYTATVNDYANAGKEANLVKVVLPKNATNIYLKGVKNTDGTCGDDTNYGWFSKDISYSIIYMGGTSNKNDRGVSISSDIVHYLNTLGEYTFVYSYLSKGDGILKKYRRTVPVDLYYYISRTNIDVTGFPVNTKEIKLEKAISPDGIEVSINEVVYRESDDLPAPTEFSAVVSGQKVSSSPGTLYLEVIVDYASPNTHRYNLVMEYEKDGVKKTVEKDFSAKVGYYASGWMDGSKATDVLKYEGNPLIFDKDVPYVKLLRIEDKDSGESVKYDQYLYCNHLYDNKCDVDCNRCLAYRETEGHDFGYDCNDTCRNCGFRRVTDGHDYIAECDDTCHICGETRETEGCRFELVCIEEVTCTRQGIYEYRCIYCDSPQGGIIYVKPGHKVAPRKSYDDTYHWNVATCDEHAGLVVDKTEHKYDSDCDATCNGCDYVRTVNDHDYVTTTIMEAGCITPGIIKKECKICGLGSNEAVAVSPLGHSYKMIIDKPATATEEGLQHEECTRCGKTKKQVVIPAFGDSPSDNTCAEHHYDDECDTICNDCGFERIVEGHYYENECDDECWYCGEKREVPDHEYVLKTLENPSCNGMGTGIMACKYCNKPDGDAFNLPALGHTYKVVIKQEATATEDGIMYEECTRCHKKTDEMYIPAGPTPGGNDQPGNTPGGDNGGNTTPGGNGQPGNTPGGDNGGNTTPGGNDQPGNTSGLGQDGTALGTGASVSAANKAILAAKSDEGPAGSVFGKLQLRAKKTTKNSITITWKKISGCKYIVYGNKCGSKYKKLGTVSKNTFTQKKLKKGKYYKYLVVAVKNGKVVSSAKTLHVATKGGKVGNYKKVTLNKTKLTLKKGKTFKLKAKQIAESKELKVKNHRKLKYESSNTKVVKVSSKGKITAVGKGTAYVYAYSQSGVFAKVKVTVK